MVLKSLTLATALFAIGGLASPASAQLLGGSVNGALTSASRVTASGGLGPMTGSLSGQTGHAASAAVRPGASPAVAGALAGDLGAQARAAAPGLQGAAATAAHARTAAATQAQAAGQAKGMLAADGVLAGTLSRDVIPAGASVRGRAATSVRTDRGDVSLTASGSAEARRR